MDILKEIIRNFTNEKYVIIKQNETIEKCNIELEVNECFMPKYECIDKIFSYLPSRDSLEIKVETISLSSVEFNKNTYDTFIQSFKFMNQIIGDKDKKYILAIEIYKTVVEGYVSVYSLDTFQKTLNALNLAGKLLFFKKALLNNEFAVFEMYDDSDSFYSCSFIFVNKFKSDLIDIKNITNKVSRQDYLRKHMQVSITVNYEEYLFIPDDFEFLRKSENDGINSMFDKLKMLFSWFFISNSYSIVCKDKTTSRNNVSIKMNGYKTIEINNNYDDICFNCDIIYNIYEWIYTEGNISDKIGIARNIITLYVTNKSDIHVDKNVLNAIESSYEIYLKESVNKYLNLRLKINENIFALINKLENLIDELVNVILKFIFGVLSVLFTIVVMNSIYAGKLVDVLSGDLAIICIGAIGILNLILFFIIIPNNKEKFERYEDEFIKMKESYIFILNSKDIEEIFDENKYIVCKRLEYNNKLKKYISLWIIINIIMISTILIA